MSAFGTNVCGRKEEISREIALNVQVPLLDVSLRVVVVVGDGEVLNHLAGIHLRAHVPQSATHRRNNAGCREWGVDRVHRNRAIDGAGV